MNAILKELFEATKRVLTAPAGLISFILFSMGIFALFIFIPVLTTPGNDFFFQLSIMPIELLLIVILLSIANGLVLAMQVHIYRTVKEQDRKMGKKQGVATLGGLIVSAFTSTVVCAACYSAVLSVFGIGTVAFLVNFRLEIAFIALLITLYAAYHAAKRINNNCEKCVVSLAEMPVV